MRSSLLLILLFGLGLSIWPAIPTPLSAQEAEQEPQAFDSAPTTPQELVDLKQELALAELRMEAALRAQDLGLLQAEIEHTAAQADLQAYNTHGREAAKAQAELDLNHQKDRLADTEEELEQLSMMYEINQLADATAQIVMDRATRDIERQRTGLAMAEKAHRYWLEFGEPREMRDLEDAARLAAAELESLHMEHVLERTELEMEVHDLRKQVTELKVEIGGQDR
ncbi:MAG: hypothetical protein ACYTEP_06935 [Planctomycetota bacterium]|jgi:hypothetical protein